jgi:two-component system, NarL family, invasion response regulator UvrY
MTQNDIKILLVDDHPIVRQSWKVLLDSNTGVKVIGETENGPRAVELADKLSPDIVLIDLPLTPTPGFTITQTLLEKMPGLKIIGISINTHPRYASRMLELGAKGFITKTSSMEEIVRGIRQVFNGETYLCEETRKLIPL